MSDTPDEKPFFDLYGMKIETADFMLPNQIAFTSPEGKILGGITNLYLDGDPIPSDKVRMTSIKASDKFDLSKFDIETAPDSFLSSVEPYLDRVQDRFFTERLGPKGGPPSEIETGALLAEIKRAMAEAMESKRKLDKSLVSALLTAGLDVRFTDITHRPQAVLPESYRAAAKEYAEEAEPVTLYRDPLSGNNCFAPRGRLYL